SPARSAPSCAIPPPPRRWGARAATSSSIASTSRARSRPPRASIARRPAWSGGGSRRERPRRRLLGGRGPARLHVGRLPAAATRAEARGARRRGATALRHATRLGDRRRLQRGRLHRGQARQHPGSPALSARVAASGYVRFEAALKAGEAGLGFLASADGAIYALRRALYRDLAASEVNDLLHPIQVCLAGYRCRFDADAQTVEPPSRDGGQE